MSSPIIDRSRILDLTKQSSSESISRIEFNPLERRDQETIGREGKGGRMRVRRMRPGAATHPGRESSGRSHWPLTPNHRPECDVWCCSGVLCGDVEKVCVHPSAHASPSAPLTQFRHRRLQSQSQPAVTTPSSPPLPPRDTTHSWFHTHTHIHTHIHTFSLPFYTIHVLPRLFRPLWRPWSPLSVHVRSEIIGCTGHSARFPRTRYTRTRAWNCWPLIENASKGSATRIYTFRCFGVLPRLTFIRPPPGNFDHPRKIQPRWRARLPRFKLTGQPWKRERETERGREGMNFSGSWVI